MIHSVSTDMVVTIAALAFLTFVAGLIYIAECAKRRKALQRWASSCGYKVVCARQPILSEASPFPISASKAQQVFRVTVQDQEGGVRSGWVLLGTAFCGLR